MKIESKDIKLVEVDALVENPKNVNRHSIEQIKRLEKLIKHHGFRQPLIVSNRSGFLIAGHGRLQVAKNLGMEKVPVIYQDFETEAQEVAFLISDNEIARWSELDRQAVFELNDELKFDDVELLGLEFDFISPADIDLDAELAEAGIESSSDSIKEGVKRAILVEFDLDDYEEAQELVNWWREQGAYIGQMLVNHLRLERERHEAS